MNIPFSIRGGGQSLKIHTENDIVQNSMRVVKDSQNQEWTEWLSKFFVNNKKNNRQNNINYIAASNTK